MATPDYIKVGALIFGAVLLRLIYRETVDEYGKEFALKAMLGVVAFFLVGGLLIQFPFRSPNSDLFISCTEAAKPDTNLNPMMTRFLADKEKQTVLMEYWTSPRDRPKDIDSVPMDNCTVHDEDHWSCSYVGSFFSSSYSRSGDVVKSTYDEPRKGASGFSVSCYQKI